MSYRTRQRRSNRNSVQIDIPMPFGRPSSNDEQNNHVSETDVMDVQEQGMVVDEDNCILHNIVNHADNEKEMERIEANTESELHVDERFFSSTNNYLHNDDTYDDDEDYDDDNDEVSDSDFDEIDIRSGEVIYNGCEATVLEIVNDLLEIFIKNKITKAALNGFLKILKKVLPSGHNFPTTLSRFFHLIENEAPIGSAKKHYYCKICRAYIESDSDSFCSSCKEKRDSGTFYELDIFHRVKFLFERQHLADKLENPTSRTVI